MYYEVRYNKPDGSGFIKEEFITPQSAIDRWLALVAVGHKSVKLTTRNNKPYGA